MLLIHKPKGTCSQEIRVETDGSVVKKVTFYGGCSGNLQGLSRLVEGRDIEDIIEKLKGIKCGFKKTSCPDQLAEALIKLKENM